jgi:hypothetical protein
MTKLVLVTLLASSVAIGKATVVKSYIKKSGSVIRAHIKTTPNNTKTDNFKPRASK